MSFLRTICCCYQADLRNSLQQQNSSSSIYFFSDLYHFLFTNCLLAQVLSYLILALILLFKTELISELK